MVKTFDMGNAGCETANILYYIGVCTVNSIKPGSYNHMVEIYFSEYLFSLSKIYD